MRRPTFLRATLVAMTLVMSFVVAKAQQGTNAKDLGKANTKSAESAFSSKSIGFIENKGQWDSKARFMADVNGLNLWVTNTGLVYNMFAQEGNTQSAVAAKKDSKGDFGNSAEKPSSVAQAVEVNFVGASSGAVLHGEGKQQGYYNYLVGNDRSKWASYVSKFNSVKVEKLYKGVDAVLYVENNQPRYDFVVAPGASPEMIAMSIKGHSGLKIDQNGELHILTEFGEIRQAGIYAYQKDMNGNNREVKCSFAIRQNGTVGFNVGSYDATRPLVIDPLVYCTYLGGNAANVATFHDVATGVAVDAGGYAYISGYTASNAMLIAGTGFTGSNAPSPTKLGAGTIAGLVAGTPTGNDVTGATNPFIASYYHDAFITKMDPNGAMVYMTIIASSADDRAMDIDIENGNAYICGYAATDSRVPPPTSIGANTLPTSLGAFQTAPNRNLNPYGMGGHGLVTTPPPVTTTYFGFSTTPGYCDAFVTGLNSTGTNIIYSTYIGGSYTQDGAFDIDVDGGQIYICGQTIFKWGINLPLGSSATAPLPTLPTLQTAAPAVGTPTNYFPTYGAAYVAFQPGPRYTAPTLAAQMTSPNGFYNVTDGFVCRLNPAVSGSSQLLYGSYFGGAGNTPTATNLYVDYVDNVSAIKVGPNQSVYITGTTIAPFLRGAAGTTVADQFPTSANGSASGQYAANQEDAFVLQLNTANTGGGQMEYGTMISTPNFIAIDNDEAWDLALAPRGGVYVTGVTYSNAAGSGINPVTGFNYAGTAFNPGYNGMNYRNSFPISANAADTRSQGTGEAFVTYVDPTQQNGNQFPYSTYIGGNQNSEWGVGIDVDDAGYVYVVGNTSSPSFPQNRVPVLRPIYTAYNIFVCKFSPRLDTLCYSRLLASSNALVAHAGFGGTTASALPPTQFPRVRNTIWNQARLGNGTDAFGEFTAQNGGGMDMDDARNVYIAGGRVANTALGGIYQIPVYTNAPYPIFDAFGDNSGSFSFPPVVTPTFDDAFILKMQPSEIAVADVGNTNVCVGQSHTVRFATSGCVKNVKIELLNPALNTVWSSDQALPTGNPRTFTAPANVGCSGAFTTYAVSDNPLFNDLFITRPTEIGPGNALIAGVIPYDPGNALINNNWEWNQDHMRPGLQPVGAGSQNDQGIAIPGTINGVESYFYGFTIPELPANVLPTTTSGVDYLAGYRWKVTQTDIRPYPQTIVADTSDNTGYVYTGANASPTLTGGASITGYNTVQAGGGRIGYDGTNGNGAGFTLVQRPMFVNRLPQNTVTVAGVTYPVINYEVCIGTTGNTFDRSYRGVDPSGISFSETIRALGAGGNPATNILNYEWRNPAGTLVSTGTMSGANLNAYTTPTTGFHTVPAPLAIPGTGPLGVIQQADAGLYYIDLVRPAAAACSPVTSACSPTPPTRIYVNVKVKQPVALAVNGGINAANNAPCESENGNLSVTLVGDNPGVIWEKQEMNGTWTAIGSSNYMLETNTNRDTVIHNNLLGSHYEVSSVQTPGVLPAAPTTVFSLKINNLILDDSVKYRVRFYNNGPCPNLVQQFAQELLLKVLPLPRITKQPLNRTVCAGATVSFSIEVFGIKNYFNAGTYSYQWRHNNQIIPGANDLIYTINSVTAADAGDYSCEVRTPCAFASVVSVDAYMVVNTAPTVTKNPTDVSVCAGDNASFSVEAKGGGLSYVWKRNGTVIAGQTDARLNLSNVSDADAGTYSVEVTGQCAPSTTTSAVLTVNKSPKITVNLPATIDACDNTPTQLDVTASGSGLSYEWYKNGTKIAGQTTSSYKFTAVKADNGAKIKVVVKGNCLPEVNSTETVITVKDGGSITDGPKDVEICSGKPASFEVKVTGGTDIKYQWKKNGVVIPGATKAIYDDIKAATDADAGFYSVEVTGACPLSLNIPLTAKLSIIKGFTITAQPSGTQSVCPGATVSYSVTVTGGKNVKYQWKRNGQALPGENKANLSFTVNTTADAGTYTCDVTDDCGTTQATTAATVNVGSVPAITAQPQGVTVCEGGNANFTLTATGGNLKYQWSKNGQPIPGATGNSYSLNNVTASDAGDYTVSVKGDCGNELVSSAGKLVVNKTVITASAVQVDFGLVLVDSVTTKDVTVSFRNSGNTDAIINAFKSPDGKGPFSIVSGAPTIPTTLKPGQEIVLVVRYKGTVGTQRDSIVVSADATCPASARIALTGTGDDRVAYAALEINNSVGDVRQTNPNYVTISYNGVPQKIIESEAASLNLEIEYNATMMSPQDPALLSQVKMIRSGDTTWGRLPLVIQPVPSSGTLKSIAMNVLLGNDSVTPVRFVPGSVKWTVGKNGGKVITTGLVDGSFKLRNFCLRGGLRGTNPFKGGVTKVSPNPVTSTMLIKYALNNGTTAKFKLFDMNGEMVFSQTEALKDNVVAGLVEREAVLNITNVNIPSGVYMLVLESEELIDKQMIIVVK